VIVSDTGPEAAAANRENDCREQCVQLVAQAGLYHGDVEFLLAKQCKLPAMLQPQEIR